MSKVNRSLPLGLIGKPIKITALATSLMISHAALAQAGPPTFNQPPPENRHPGEGYRKYDLNNASDRSDPKSAGNLYSRAISLTRCIGKKHPEKLAGLLDQPLSGQGEKLAAQDIGRTARMCSDGRVEMSMRVLRGAAAEALLGGMAAPEKMEDAQVKAYYAAMPQAEGGDQSACEV